MHSRRLYTTLVKPLLRCEEGPAWARWFVSQPSPLRQQVGRRYATPARSPALQLKGGRSSPHPPPSPGPTQKDQFAFADKDMLATLASGATRSLTGVDPAEAPAFLATTKKYFQALARNPSMSGAALEQEYGIPPSELLRLGAMVITGSDSPHYWRLGTQMLVTASAAGHMPATLSLLQFFAGMGEKGRLSRVYQDSDKRFLSYLKTSTGRKDPDALTVAGLRAGWTKERAGWEQVALGFFLEAVKVGSLGHHGPGDATTDLQERDVERRSVRWLTEASCYKGLGELYMGLGERELAQWALRIAALELDIPEAYYLLAELLPDEAPEKETYLTKAAMSSHRGAMRRLAQLLRGKAERQPDGGGGGGGGGDGPAQLRMAREWEALASDSSGDQNSAAVAA